MTTFSPRVLVVDDNRDAADLLAEILSLHGLVVRAAYGGAEAVAATGEFQPDVLLLDLGMPHVDGFAVAAALRKLPCPPSLVALSAWDDAATRARTRKAGFVAHLRKPSSIDAILGAIGDAVMPAGPVPAPPVRASRHV